MTAKTLTEAWKIVEEIFPTDFNYDHSSSARAGYDVYRSTVNPLDYICNLGNRVEVNLASGKTINVWLESDFNHEEKVEICGYIDDFLGRMEYNFDLHSNEMKRYGLDEIMEKLSKIYNELA